MSENYQPINLEFVIWLIKLFVTIGCISLMILLFISPSYSSLAKETCASAGYVNTYDEIYSSYRVGSETYVKCCDYIIVGKNITKQCAPFKIIEKQFVWSDSK